MSIATHLIHKAGYTNATADTGAVTLIQRFGSALNLNIQFHILFPDGVYVENEGSTARFRWVKAPADNELTQLIHTIEQRLKRVFNIDVGTCRVCGGAAKVIACIEDPMVIKTILAHIEAQAPKPGESVLPDSRAPPQASLFS